MSENYLEEFSFSESVQSTESGVCVAVRTAYLPELSNPEKSIFSFIYVIDIQNFNQSSIQLVSRRWLITNAEQKQQEVSGAGVVGQQPFLEPSQSYRYNSWVQLDTPVGQMGGHYAMREVESGKKFNVSIPRFDLICPRFIN